MRMLVAGGGSGGHLFPGVAVAERWLAMGDEQRVAFAGNADGFEGRVVPELGYRFFPVRSGAVYGRGLRGALAGLLRVAKGLTDAGRALDGFDPHVVLGVGGYASVPVVLRAVLARRPTAIHEQNARPGLANRWLGRIVDRTLVSHPGSESHFPRGRAQLAGNPVRPALVADLERTRAERQRRAPGDGITVLVFGGSQGARFLNRVVPEAIAELARRGIALRVTHQTGPTDEAEVRDRYRSAGLEADVRAFIHDIGRAYGEADVAICRAGAGTLAELALVGLPALLVPYPLAGGHQEANARAYAVSGAAVCLPERELDGQRLADALADLAVDPEGRAAMSDAARAQARPGAADLIAAECRRLAEGRRGALPDGGRR